MAALIGGLRIAFAFGLLVVTLCGVMAFLAVFALAAGAIVFGMAILAFLLSNIPAVPL